MKTWKKKAKNNNNNKKKTIYFWKIQLRIWQWCELTTLLRPLQEAVNLANVSPMWPTQPHHFTSSSRNQILSYGHHFSLESNMCGPDSTAWSVYAPFLTVRSAPSSPFTIFLWAPLDARNRTKQNFIYLFIFLDTEKMKRWEWEGNQKKSERTVA